MTDWKSVAERLAVSLEEALPSIEHWSKAYPEDIFPLPDLDEVRSLIGGDALTRVSADSMRHVATSIWRKLEPANNALESYNQAVKDEQKLFQIQQEIEMSVSPSYKCDVCSTERREVNKWFIVEPCHEGGMVINTWHDIEQVAPELLEDKQVKHICGQTCLVKVLNEWMNTEKPTLSKVD